MSTVSVYAIFIILIIIVFVLGIYLGVLMTKLKQQKRQSAEIQKVIDLGIEQREQFLIDSILTISKATLQGQCEPSEACIRLKKLLENYPEIEQKEDLAIIQTMYGELEEFAFLDDRKKLSTGEKFKQDTKRFKVEEKFKDEFSKSLDLLVGYFEAKT